MEEKTKKRPVELTEEEQAKVERKKKKMLKKQNKLKEKQDTVLTNQNALTEQLKNGPSTGDLEEPVAEPDPTNPKKKKKRKKKTPAQKEEHIHESAALGKCLKYLETWANDRGNWKFEKCRQIWLIQNCYDNKKITDAQFDSLLQYIASIKGQMRASTLKTAQDKADLEEKWKRALEDGQSEEEVKKAMTNDRLESHVLQRAQEIVSMLE
eukprot:maker-scaffold1364_size45483-snap-gene-0.12 protein:Tk09915 transcript:maker-scaffold1364_size45483-snap-gene-0.12-mRNA-1 annotation:"hypothetical protein L798_06534"